MSDRPLSVQIAAEIRKQLFLRDMTATQLGEQAGMTQPYISRRLTGATAFDVDDLQRIAEALDMQIADLLPAPAPAKTRRDDGLMELSEVMANRPRSWGNLHPVTSPERPPVPGPRVPANDIRPAADYAGHTAGVGRTRRAVRIRGGVTA